MGRSGVFLALFFLCGRLFGESGQEPGILPENCYRFLKLGQVNYSINVNPEGIVYGEERDPAAVAKEIDRRKAEIRKRPKDLPLKLSLAEFYSDSDMYGEAQALFKTVLPDLKKGAEKDKTDDALFWYAWALSVTSDNKKNDEAHLLLQPLLESGKAPRKVFELAIRMRVAVQDFNLAARIADAYAAVFPDDPEPYYQRFMNVFAKNLTGIISYIYSAVSGDFLKSKGLAKIDKDNLPDFFNEYFSRLNEALSISDLDRAVSLAPDSYKYCLSAGVFKTLVLFYTSMASKAQVSGLEDMSIVDALKVMDGSGLAQALKYLTRAHELRPDKDIQVFLGLAMYSLCTADYEQAQGYAKKAIATRPGAMEGYDALITTIALPRLTSGTEDLDALLGDIAVIIGDKIAKTGGSPNDYATLAGFGLKKYGKADAGERKKILARMLDNADKALKMEPGHNLAILTEATYLMLSGNYRKALEAMDKLEPSIKDEFKDMLYNNRGVLKVLLGKKDEGIADLKKALELTADNATTKEALAAVGVKPDAP
jgi:tetratricopeptide (TPR) repeat protein